MYRLAELSEFRRKAIGGGLVVMGIIGLVIGVITIHWGSLPETDVVDYLNWFPRGTFWKGLGYLIVLGATTFVLIGSAFLLVLNQPMTWTRAAWGALITWFAFVFYFGMVPSEWLNFATTDLEWSAQEVFIVIPPWLVLGNEVEISYKTLKEAIQAGYSTNMLIVAAVLALQLQKMKRGRPENKQPANLKSPYGRPLVKGGG